MKQKKIIQVITLVAIAIVFLGAGFALGRSGQSKEAAGDTVKVQESQYGAEAKEEKTSKKAGTRSVAVVNLDNGVEQNGSNINYAASLIQFPNNDFSYTSLEEARTGITSGTYAAYVIIPSAFSANIQSLNTTMTKSGITYELNQNLPEEDKLAALKQLNSFIQGMSDHVSILYMSGVMKEFHGAQDSALTVMANDKEDVDAISVISPHDLEKYVRFPQLAQPDMKVSALDIQGYITQNGELISNIEKEYERAAESAKEESETLKEQGGTVNSQFEFTNKAIQGVDITKNAKGHIVYDAKLNTVENTLKDYNLTLETNRKQIQENVDIAEKEAGNLRSYWDGTQYGIGRYEEETTDAVTTLASILSSGNVEVNTDAVPEYSVNTESGVISMSGTDYPILTVGETIEDGAAVALNKEVLDVFLQAYLEEYKGLIKSTATYSVGEGTDITDGVRIEVLIKDTLPVCDPSKFVKTNDPDNPYDGTNPSSTNIKEVNEIFDDMIETRLAFDTAAEGDFKIDTTISGKLEDVQEAVNVDVINPLEENKSLINSQYKESYEKSAGVLLDFQNQLGLYDPMQHLNQSVIQDSYTDMQSNGSDMQKTITERDA
ncbi:hypothetical protein, partial [Muricomes intestini]|uniref:YhgE/Pip domain-containing protein n=1 Tax=Muricomes intestini TaxID=1796634 RepID=UPI002FE2855D